MRSFLTAGPGRRQRNPAPQPRPRQPNRLSRRALVCSLTLTLLTGFGAAAQADESKTGYSGSALPEGNNRTPYATPRWSLELDGSAEGHYLPEVVVADGKAIFLRQGVLTAVSIDTGRTVWSYGSGMTGPIHVEGDRLLTASADGRLHFLALNTGKALWTAKLREPLAESRETVYTTAAMGDTAIYVTYFHNGGGIAAFTRNDGTKLWSNDSFEYMGGVSLQYGDLLLNTAVSGALTLSVTYRIDPATGDKITQFPWDHTLLHRDGDRGYYRNQYMSALFDSEHAFHLNIVDIGTGEIIDSKAYLPLPEEREAMYNQAGKAAIDGGQLFVQDRSGEVYQFHLDAEEGAPPTAVFNTRDEWIAGPYDGKLFFTDASVFGTVYAVKLIDRTRVNYEGLDNPASRVDLIGRGLFVGQTDGDIYALNVGTGKALFRYASGSRVYGPFRVSGGVLLAQTERGLLAFDLPAELLPPSDAELAKAPPGTDAILTIDGESQRFEPNPVMIDNRMFVPMRSLFQAVGADVQHDQTTNQVHVVYRDRAFALKEGAPFAVVGGEQQAMSYAPALLGHTLYVPLRDVGALLGIDVLWVDASRTVEITTAAAAQPQP